MGAVLLRVSKLQAKWRVKLARALEARDDPKAGAGSRFKAFCEKYAMFLLPFITVLREGLEAVVFIGGVSLGLPAESIPLAAITGIAAGCLIGFFIYKQVFHSLLESHLLTSQLQGWQLCADPDFPDFQHMLPLSGSCRTFLPSCLVS